MRRMLMSGMEENDVKEWKLVADVVIEEGATTVKIPLDTCDEYIIVGNIYAQSNTALNIAVNREGYDWVQHRIIALNNGVNSNPNKRFCVKIQKIGGLYTKVNSAASFETVVPSEEKMYMSDINAQEMEAVKYFHFSTSNSTPFTSGYIKVFAR